MPNHAKTVCRFTGCNQPPFGRQTAPGTTSAPIPIVRMCRHTIARNALCKHNAPRCGDKSPQAPRKTVPFRLPHHARQYDTKGKNQMQNHKTVTAENLFYKRRGAKPIAKFNTT